MPKTMKSHGALRSRYFRIRFSSRIKKLDERRVIATLYVCMVRRIKQTYGTQISTFEQGEERQLSYNRQTATILPIMEKQTNHWVRSMPQAPLFTKLFQSWQTSMRQVKVNRITKQTDDQKQQEIEGEEDS